MDLGKVSKAIASAIVGIIMMWASTVTDMMIPIEMTEWLTAAVATGIAAVFGFFVTWRAPQNKE